jgi:ABC-2 type transport system ATP-binding protein
MIASLRELGKTIFLTTHYMDEAQALADRVAILAGGRIVAEGPPAELGDREQRATLIRFRLPPGTGADGLPPAIRDAAGLDGEEVTLQAEDPVPPLAELTSWAAARGVGLPGLEVRRPSLEDVYLELTERESEGGGE